MSTSLLHHGFAIRGYRHVRTEYVGGGLFRIDQDRRNWRCSACGSENVSPKGRKSRRFRCLPIGNRPVTIVFPIPRVRCHDCGKIRQVNVLFADNRLSYTKAFQRYALDLSQAMTIRDVADHLGVGWDIGGVVVRTAKGWRLLEVWNVSP